MSTKKKKKPKNKQKNPLFTVRCTHQRSSSVLKYLPLKCCFHCFLKQERKNRMVYKTLFIYQDLNVCSFFFFLFFCLLLCIFCFFVFVLLLLLLLFICLLYLIYLFTYLFIYLFIYSSIHLFIYLFIYLSIYFWLYLASEKRILQSRKTALLQPFITFSLRNDHDSDHASDFSNLSRRHLIVLDIFDSWISSGKVLHWWNFTLMLGTPFQYFPVLLEWKASWNSFPWYWHDVR